MVLLAAKPPFQNLYFLNGGCVTFNLASGFRIICARWAIAPVSTMVWASSGECLAMSLKAEAATLFRAISGSWMHNTSRGTTPASTTAWDSSAHQERRWTTKGTLTNCEKQKKKKTFLKETHVHYVWQCSLLPMPQPLWPQGQTPPRRRQERPVLHSPPRPGPAQGSA